MSNQDAVILFSHGSLLCGSGAALERQVAALRRRGQFAAVEPGYLNYSSPSIEEALRRCQQASAGRIIVVPFFLVAGKFVKVDLPARLEVIKAAEPHLNFRMARAIEDAEMMDSLLKDLVRQVEDPVRWQAGAIAEARANCQVRQDCPLYGTALCREHSGRADVPVCAEPDATGDFPTVENPVSSTALLMILHGSPRPEANEPALKLAEKLASSAEFDHVEVAYLECNQPEVPSALENLRENNVGRITVLPYFLHPGRHMVLDVVGYLTRFRAENPGITVNLCPAVGESPHLTEVLLHRISEAQEK